MSAWVMEKITIGDDSYEVALHASGGSVTLRLDDQVDTVLSLTGLPEPLWRWAKLTLTGLTVSEAVKIVRSIPVHRAHCCPAHGCKYAEATCPVVNKAVEQSLFGCEACERLFGSEPCDTPEPVDPLAQPIREQPAGECRADYMLRVAARYIREHCPDGVIVYDEAECDGSCVADDCESAIGEHDGL